jgi:hypothetical protein
VVSCSGFDAGLSTFAGTWPLGRYRADGLCGSSGGGPDSRTEIGWLDGSVDRIVPEPHTSEKAL